MEPLNSMFGNPYKGSPPKHCSRRRSIGKAVISVNAIQAVPATAKAKKGVFFPEHREIGIGWFFVTTFDEQKQSHRPRLIARKINSKLSSTPSRALHQSFSDHPWPAFSPCMTRIRPGHQPHEHSQSLVDRGEARVEQSALTIAAVISKATPPTITARRNPDGLSVPSDESSFACSFVMSIPSADQFRSPCPVNASLTSGRCREEWKSPVAKVLDFRIANPISTNG